MISWYIDSSCITSPRNTESRVCHPARTTTMLHRGGYNHGDALSWWLRAVVHGHESLAPGPEETLGVADPVREGIYLGVGVVHVERRPGAGLNPQRAVQRPGAVVAGAHRDAQLVEHLAHVVRVNAVHLERDGTTAVLGGIGPEDANAAEFAQRVEGVRGERLLVRGHVPHAQAGEIIDGSGQACGLRHGGHAGLEPLRRRQERTA